MGDKQETLNIALISIHGLIRGHNLELGRDADTGGQTLYVLELARALANQSEVKKVNLFTRRVSDDSIDNDYAEPIEVISDKLRIVRIDTSLDGYTEKEQLWDELNSFADNLEKFFNGSNALPDVFHSHYADAGFVGSHLANVFGIPLIHTGHSLGRVKRSRLLANGASAKEIEDIYNIARRIEAEETALATAERVITSTHQEIEDQYEVYDHYQPDQMRVIPPGTDLNIFKPATSNLSSSSLFKQLTKHLVQPKKPIILALSRPDKRKNIIALVETYGSSLELQEKANLVIIAGNRDDIDDLDYGAKEVFHELLVAIDRYDLYSKVTLPKHHKREEVASIYQIASQSGGVFINPALTEPFGLTLIEAAACGLPIVATEDGGPRDIIENCQNGFLINPLEQDEISTALLKLLDDKKLWQELSENGLRGVREHYTWQAHAKRYLQVVKPIVARSEQLTRAPVKRSAALYKDRAIVTDLDQNLLGDNASLQTLLKLLRHHRKTTMLAIVTGRRLDVSLKLMRKHNIPEPDILITSGGTEIHYLPELSTDSLWTRHIDYQWTPHKIRKILDEYPSLKKQPKLDQSRFKLSYYINTEIASIHEIKSLLHQQEQTVYTQVAFGQFLDILPTRASKGLALRYVAERWQVPLDNILVAGGSGADEDMMRGNTLAAVVANRHHEELSQLADTDRVYFANKPFAAGILEAIEYYDFFNSCKDPNDINE